MNSDFKDLLQAFADHRVRYLIVGGQAVIFHGQPRFTKDLDVWVEPTPENARQLAAALRQFGIPLIEVTEEDFSREGTQFMVGTPPVAIDFLTSVPGLDFSEAWERRIADREDGLTLLYLCRADLKTAKKVAGRPIDLADLDELEKRDG
jgi:hypothetical protein